MKNILLISSGVNPQVITETIYYYKCVHRPSFLFNEVHIVTDLIGKKKIDTDLLGEGGALNRLFKDYHIDPKEIRLNRDCIHLLKNKNNIFLNDIRTSADNEDTISTVFRLVQKFTSKKNTVLYTSVAGGRKTMSVIVGQAMQFFGRNRDRLIHVLINDLLFNTKKFFYPTPYKKEIQIENRTIDISKETVNVHEIPYVRLRPILGDILKQTNKSSLNDLVKNTQEKINDFFGPIIVKIDHKNIALVINDLTVKLPAKNLALYAAFDEKIKERKNQPSFISLDEALSKPFLLKYLDKYRKIRGEKNIFYLKEKSRINNDKVINIFFTKEWLMESKSKINRVLSKALPPHIYQKVSITTKGPYGEKRYGILIDA